MTGRRYWTLDAMRGVAALAVFCLHAGALINPVRLPHAYLAVDLFFLLSGFVIDHAYRDRLASGMSVRAFVVARYVRLYPLYLVGMAVGASAAMVAMLAGRGVLSGTGYGIALVSGLLMLPSPTWPGDASLVPFNYPGWSLLFEMAINIAFAMTWRWWRLPVLVPFVVAAGFALCWTSWTYGSIDFGAMWLHPWIGFVRVTFAFTLGVVLHRAMPVRPYLGLAAWPVPFLAIPLFLGFGGAEGDLLIILFAFPILILLAATVEPTAGRPVFALLGTVSYPLYVIHIPLMQLLERAMTVLRIDKAAVAPWAGLALGGFVVALAWALDRWYDVPVRRWLTMRLKDRASARTAARNLIPDN